MTKPTKPTASDKKKRVLLAEDDPAIAEMLTRYLGQRYDLTVVGDGPGALAVATKPPPPDLILLDVMMPGIDGFGVAQRLKLVYPKHKIPLIFITGRDAPHDIIQGIQHGARQYITKPFKLKDVLEKIEHALGT